MAHHFYQGKVTEIPFQARYLDRLAAASTPETVFQEALDDCLVDQSSLLQNKHVCLVLDQTTSNTALTMPVAQLAAQMKARHSEALVVVDGAHGLLAQNTNLSSLFAAGVDIYVTNGHKWLSAPRGVGFLAVASPDLAQSVLRCPAVLSHGIHEPDLFSRFVWDGCRDYAAALSIPSVVDYWKRRNPDIVRLNCKDMLRQGIQILAAKWYGDSSARDAPSWPGHVTLVGFDSSLLSPMALVCLPSRRSRSDHTSTDAKTVQDYLYSQLIEVPIKCINGKLYVRVSCHIYNELKDFEHLATAIQRMPWTTS
jgi:selenocysteine lyase/cysteine desulfurase